MKPGIPAARVARNAQEDSERPVLHAGAPLSSVVDKWARNAQEPTPIHDALVSAYETKSLEQYLRRVHGLIYE